MYHWQSFRWRLMPFLQRLLDIPLVDVYRDSLELWGELDWYGFQNLPVMDTLREIYRAMQLGRMGATM